MYSCIWNVKYVHCSSLRWNIFFWLKRHYVAPLLISWMCLSPLSLSGILGISWTFLQPFQGIFLQKSLSPPEDGHVRHFFLFLGPFFVHATHQGPLSPIPRKYVWGGDLLLFFKLNLELWLQARLFCLGRDQNLFWLGFNIYFIHFYTMEIFIFRKLYCKISTKHKSK